MRVRTGVRSHPVPVALVSSQPNHLISNTFDANRSETVEEILGSSAGQHVAPRRCRRAEGACSS